MSTFAFAPTRIAYPNQPQTLKKLSSSTDQHSETPNTSNVWSNSRLIHRIQLSAEEKANELEDEEWQEKQYELERLKALVPKTKKKTSLNNHPKKPTQLQYTHASKKSVTKLPNKRLSPVVQKEKASDRIPTKEEQRRFLGFLQSWTSTHILSHSSCLSTDNLEHHESYFHHEPFPINSFP